jgi:signal recognition particle subunit SEC65
MAYLFHSSAKHIDVHIRLMEKYSRDRQTCGKLAMKATIRIPRASKLVDVAGMMELDAVPHDDMVRPGLVATARAAIVKEKNATLVQLADGIG